MRVGIPYFGRNDMVQQNLNEALSLNKINIFPPPNSLTTSEISLKSAGQTYQSGTTLHTIIFISVVRMLG